MRDRFRRGGWRVSAGALFAACAVRWAGGPDTGDFAGWTACLALAPTLLEPLAWRLLPGRLRRVDRAARMALRLRTKGRPAYRGYDPDRGAVGRPVPALSDQAPRRPGAEPVTASLTAPTGRPRGDGPWLELRWDGHRLTLADGVGGGLPVPTAPGAEGLGRRGFRRPVAELVWYEERFLYGRGICLVLLDRDGYRVGTVLRATDQWREIAALARAAGVRFAAYDLGYVSDARELCAEHLFPARRHEIVLSAGRGTGVR